MELDSKLFTEHLTGPCGNWGVKMNQAGDK